jgi:hypothetical protein
MTRLGCLRFGSVNPVVTKLCVFYRPIPATLPAEKEPRGQLPCVQRRLTIPIYLHLHVFCCAAKRMHVHQAKSVLSVKSRVAVCVLGTKSKISDIAACDVIDEARWDVAGRIPRGDSD